MSTLPLHLISIAYRPSTFPPQFSFLYLLPIISFSSSVLIFSFPQFHHYILSSPCHLRKGHWDRRIDHDLSCCSFISLFLYLHFSGKNFLAPPLLRVSLFTAVGQRPFFSLTVSVISSSLHPSLSSIHVHHFIW